MKSILALLLAIPIAALLGCGGGSETTPAGMIGTTHTQPMGPIPLSIVPPPGQRSLGGIWNGTAHWAAHGSMAAKTVNVRAFAGTNGWFRFVLADGTASEEFFSSRSEQISGRFGYEGGELITGSTAWTQTPTSSDPADLSVGGFTMHGTFPTSTRFSARFSSGWINDVERNGTIELDYDAAYDRDSSLATLQGIYGTATTMLTIDANGAIFFQSSATGCTGTGEAGLINPDYNMYRIRITLGNCTGVDSVRNHATFSGLAMLVGGSSESLELALSATIEGPYWEFWFLHWNLRADRQ